MHISAAVTARSARARMDVCLNANLSAVFRRVGKFLKSLKGAVKTKKGYMNIKKKKIT